MMIFQISEHHGKHIAYDMNEAKRNEDNGWKTVTREEFYGKVQSSTETEDIYKKYEELFGKKPHHKMKPETIKEKIDAHGT